MDVNSNVSLAEDLSTIPENSLGLFLLEIWSMLEVSDQRAMVAIGPEVRGQQELVIDRHDFGLVWTTAPPAKVDKWVRHGGGYDTPLSERILMGRSDTEHWATPELVREQKGGNGYNVMSYYPKPINPQCRLRALIVNPRVIADEGLMPECVTRNDAGDIIIDNGFLTGVEASSVWFVGAEDVVCIRDDFLRYSTVQQVYLHGLSSVTSIGDHFLDECTALTTVYFHGLSSVIIIGYSFLYGCTSLNAVSFDGFGNITRIGGYFLSDCKSLATVSFEGLSSVTDISIGFLRNCTSLTTVSFGGLSSVTDIGGYFLCGCTSLNTVSFDGLSSIAAIGEFLLGHCTSLITVSFEGLSSVTHIGGHLLHGCTSLSYVSFQGLSSVTDIDHYFLEGCTSLTTLSLDGLDSVTYIGYGFLKGCTSLKASGITASDAFRRRFESRIPTYVISA